jgi:hypothetical protein
LENIFLYKRCHNVGVRALYRHHLHFPMFNELC